MSVLPNVTDKNVCPTQCDRQECLSYPRHAGTAAGKCPHPAGWAIIGLGTLTNIALELDLLGPDRRRALMTHVGSFLLDGAAPGE